MSTYITTILALCFISVLAAAYISKSKGTLMEYMVFIMSFSMSIGLSIGLYFGMLFKGDLLSSTLLSILITSVSGFVIGLRFHLYSALEGMFSGLMAGMMGAMTAEMLNMQQAHTVLLISVLLTIAITMSCMIQFLSEAFSIYIHRRFLLLLLTGVIIIFAVFITFPKGHTNEPLEHKQHMHQ
ncbi:MAG: hypothetical protein ACE3JP_04595 [Ectobacillus sp.]